VSEPKIAQELTMTSFTDDMRSRGLRPASETLDLRTVPAGARLGRLLHVSPSESVLVAERLRLADGESMAIETVHIRASHVPGLTARDLEERSFYELLRDLYGIVVVDATHNEIAGNEIDGFHELPFGQRGDGIYLYRSADNVVARNRIRGERDAIYFQYAPRGRAVDNIVSESRYALHDMFSDDAVIADNVFSDSAVGANIMNSRRIRVERNRLLRNRGVPGVGITLKDCDDATVRDNAIADNARGLLVDGSSASSFIGNTFSANDTAVTLFSSAEQNAFSGNRFLDNWSDVVLSGGGSTTRWSIDGRGNYWGRYGGFDFDGDGIGDSPHPLLGAFERI
jgi:parallel beta-helix repeat protein